jgi:hypothetical protein
VPEEEPVDDLVDIEAELEPNAESEEEIELPPPKIAPTGTTICPRCKSEFQPSEVLEYTTVGIRCPHCNQSIVL